MKLNLMGILTESASFYKNNFKYLIGFSFIFVIVNAFMIGQIIIMEMFMAQPASYESITIMGGWLILMVGMLVILLIFGPRFMLAIIVLINSVMKKKAMTLNQSYRETKGKYWITLGCSILVSIISVLPAMILLPNYENYPFMLLIDTLYSTAISALFFMLLPLIALSKNSKGYIGRAVKLIKGHYSTAFFLYALTSSLPYFLYISVDNFLSAEIPSRVILLIFYALILFFVFPLSQVVMVVMYRKLAGDDAPEISQEMVDLYVNNTFINNENMQEQTFLLRTEFRTYTNEEINAQLLVDIINSSFDTWDWMVLQPDKPFHGSNFIQVGSPVVGTDAPFTLEIGFGDSERSHSLYLLETMDKNVVLQHFIAYLEEQVIPDVSLWEDISDRLPQ
jgi:hypothetical protein